MRFWGGVGVSGGGCKGVSGVYIGEGGFCKGGEGRVCWRNVCMGGWLGWKVVLLSWGKKNSVESGWCLG